MLKRLVLVCWDNFRSNKLLIQVRMMLLDRRGCKGMSDIRISNPKSETLEKSLSIDTDCLSFIDYKILSYF